MSTKYDQILARLDELTTQLADEKIIRDNQRWRKLAKERADMAELAEVAGKLKKVERTIADNHAVIEANEDPELVSWRSRMESLEAERARWTEVQVLRSPDPADEKNTIMELRAGTGGEESRSSPATCSACTRASSSARNGRPSS
jgi:peptide chain release factor 1